MTSDVDSPADLTRSALLAAYVHEQIKNQQGWMSFAEFMEAVLYHPAWGYYQASSFDIGQRGDFITAPELSPIFAACFVEPYLRLTKMMHQPAILEFGAGTGRFACDLLEALPHADVLPSHYFIYERSETLRNKQRAFVEMYAPHHLARMTWLHALPQDFKGLVIANEVIDAFPVHRFRVGQQGIEEVGVSSRQAQFVWQGAVPASPVLQEEASRLVERYSLPVGYESEINLAIAPWLKNLAQSLTQALVLLVDYGYGEREYYHPGRHRGSLTCFYRHRHHADPLCMPGLQDVTAHVDFTRVAEHAFQSGFKIAGYTSQAGFLLAGGLAELVEKMEKTLTEAERFKLHQAVKILTFPAEMGERIKVMALTRNLPAWPPVDFAWPDRRRELE